MTIDRAKELLGPEYEHLTDAQIEELLASMKILVGMSLETVSVFLQKIQKMETLPKLSKSAIQHESDFDLQVYSIWKCRTPAKIG